MAARKKTPVNRKLLAKARELLAFAEERPQHAADWVELDNALFAIGGKATQLFPTPAERAAFCRTDECKRIYALFDSLPSPSVKEFIARWCSSTRP